MKVDPELKPPLREAGNSKAGDERIIAKQTRIKRFALRVCLAYLIVAGLWIFFSDRVLVALVSDPKVIGEISMIKGWIFVAVTALLLYFVLRNHLRDLGNEAAERKRAGEKLDAALAQLRQLVEHSPAVLYTLRLEGERIILRVVSENLTRLLGFAVPKETSYDWWFGQLHPDDRNRATAGIPETLNLGASRTEYRLRHKDGNYRWVEDNRRLVLDSAGSPAEFVGIWTDITERKLAEEALRESQSLHHSFVEQLPNAAFRKDKEGRFVMVNSRFCQIKGLKPEDFLGKKALEIPDSEKAMQGKRHLQSKYAAAGEDIHKQIMRTGKAVETEEEYANADGGKIFLHVVRMPVFGADGTVVGTQGIQFDITERKRAEEALAESKRHLDKIINSVADPIFVKNRQHRWVLVNEACSQFIGRKREELLGKSNYDFFPKEQADEFWSKDEAVFTTGMENVNEEKYSTADGEVRTIITKKTLYTDEKGEQFIVGIISDITKRKEAEQQLRKLSQAVEQSPVSIIITDRAGNIEYVNSGFTRVTGYSSAEVLGKNPRILKSGEHAAPVYKQLWDTITAGKEWRGELRNRKKNGELFWERASISPVLDAKGKPTHHLAVKEDITELKRAQEMAEQEHEHFKFIFDSVPLGISLVLNRPDGTLFRLINDAHLRICGLTREQAEVRKNFLRISHPDDRQRQAELTREVDERRANQFSMEKRYCTLDGRIVWVVFSLQRRHYPDGSFEDLTTVVDITERKLAEEALRQERDLLNNLTISIPDHIYFKDLQSRFVRINGPMARHFKLHDPDEAVGKTDFDMFAVEHAQAAFNDEQRIMTTGEPIVGLEEKETWPDGHVTWVSTTKVPMRNAAGEISGLVGISRDVTAHKHLEEQLRQSQKMEAVGRLAGGVAHDFNNILAVIQMVADLMKTSENATPEQLGFAHDIAIAAERAAALTRQLLLFGRKSIMQPRNLDMNDGINNMAKMLRRILGEDIQLQFKFAMQPLFIHADPGMMDQVLMNLAVNSRDAMPKGGELVIESAAVEFNELTAAQSPQARSGSFVCVRISDTGCGIPPEDLPRVFEPFFTTKGVGKGTGLGLATVFGIVQQHQGWINVYSELGRGTTFRIYLPRLTEMTEEKIEQLTLATAPIGDETILLVEDDALVRVSLQKTLSKLGYNVIEAINGVEALEIWKQRRDEIQLVLTDLVMPGGINGKELVERLLKDKPELKVIYSSGYSADVAGKDLTLKEGVNYLTKPFQAHKLAQTIRARLDG